MRKFNIKPSVNKNNNQINISLPRKKLPKEFIKNLDRIKKCKINLEDWAYED